MTDYDTIVLGGGPAGVTAALRACELGASVALVERHRLGGTCTNDGCAPTRVLARAARLVRNAEQYGNYGLSGEAPTLDLPDLLARTQETVYRLHQKKQLLDHLEQAGAVAYTEAGTAQFSDPRTLVLQDGRRLRARRFIICVGGHARRLSFPGSELTLTHSDVWRLTRLPSSVAIVGAAATGCQLASIFAAFGSEVTLLDVAPTILGAEDEAVAEAMTDAFRARGISVLTGIGGIERVEQQEEGLRLFYTNRGTAQQLDAEAIILAVGWVGNVEGLGLEAAGVQHERGYIQVNDALQTSARHIFAAGDVTGRMMLVQSATHEARVATENALLDGDRSHRHYIVPHGGFTDPEYGSVGLTESQANATDDCAVAVIPYADLDRAVIDNRTEGFCKLVVSATRGQILGAHVVGEQAVEVVQMVAAGMKAGMDVRELAELELAYPTFTAIVGLAARQLVSNLNLTPLAPQWRALRPLAPHVSEWERGASEETKE